MKNKLIFSGISGFDLELPRLRLGPDRSPGVLAHSSAEERSLFPCFEFDDRETSLHRLHEVASGTAKIRQVRAGVVWTTERTTGLHIERFRFRRKEIFAFAWMNSKKSNCT